MGKILKNLYNWKNVAENLMTLKELRVQALKERKEGRLSRLPQNFTNRITKMEGQIKETLQNSKTDNKRFEKATSDIRKLLDLKLELYKHRERKLTDLARERINGQNPNTENVHKNEQEYLTSLCEVIENHRKKTLLSKVNEIILEPEIKELKVEGEIEEEIIEEEPVAEKKEIAEEYIEVKVLEDLPTFTGMDAKNYTLKNNKKEVIPIYNAKILSDAGKVKIITEVKA